ncbi:MAG: hypothetical protein KY475_13400 [Planctomycetes bacterium]|nr:hypothetical protein [Planctomycetota bacterium]
MPLSFATPPVDGTAVLTRGLQDLSAASTLGAAAKAPPGAQVMEPHPVYEMGLSDLDAGKGFGAGWRYLLVENQNIVQAAELSGPPPGGGPPKFNALTTGYAGAMEDVFDKAEHLPEVAGHDYEIRALRVPGLYVMALWLKDLKGTDDRFLLVPPTFPPFNKDAVYDPNDLLQLLHTAASKKLAQEQQVKYP